MSSCTTSINGQGRRFLTVGVYILVALGFFMNVHIIQHYSTVWVRTLPMLATTYHADQMKKGGTLSACEAFNTSVAVFWKQFESEIKEAAVKNATFWPEEQNSNSEFHEWVDKLFQNHYQSYQVRRSAIHPPGFEVTLKVLEIISKRVDYLRDPTLSAAPPLHILVSGGSLTSGMSCGVNHIGLKVPGWHRQYTECAWPARLEHLFLSLIHI